MRTKNKTHTLNIEKQSLPYLFSKHIHTLTLETTLTFEHMVRLSCEPCFKSVTQPKMKLTTNRSMS